MSIQSDGKILVGGEFTSYSGVTTRNRIIRLNSGGTIDNTFQIGSGFDTIVRTLAIQSDGKILVGGEFTSYSGVSKSRIIRLNTGGTIDETFQIGTGFSGSGLVLDIEQQSDGKILVGGSIESYDVEPSLNNIIRLNSDGSVDTIFGDGFDGTVRAIKQQSNNKILVGGDFQIYSGITSNKIIRLNTNGSVDSTFGDGFAGSVTNILINSDDEIIIMGDYNTYDGQVANDIIRINNDGNKTSD
jgi:uncharacterized delta-60 repeat protein